MEPQGSEVDLDSTLIRRGVKASTFTDMAAFAGVIETRPLSKLLEELPGIASLSDMKFRLARQVIRRRARELAPVDLDQLRLLAGEIADSNPSLVAERIRGIFATD
jgi:hypothetical protein